MILKTEKSWSNFNFFLETMNRQPPPRYFLEVTKTRILNNYYYDRAEFNLI